MNESLPAWISERAACASASTEGGGGGVVKRTPVSSNVSRIAQSLRGEVDSLSVLETAPPGKTWALGNVVECVGRWTRRISLRGFNKSRLLLEVRIPVLLI